MVLLDANVLIALAVENHVHHRATLTWFGTGRPFATCPITQGALIRMLLRHDVTATQAEACLAGFTGRSDHAFWPDDVGFGDVALTGVVGHRQVTDAYLAALARSHDGRLATFDRGLAALCADVAEVIADR